MPPLPPQLNDSFIFAFYVPAPEESSGNVQGTLTSYHRADLTPRPALGIDTPGVGGTEQRTTNRTSGLSMPKAG